MEWSSNIYGVFNQLYDQSNSSMAKPMGLGFALTQSNFYAVVIFVFFSTL